MAATEGAPGELGKSRVHGLVVAGCFGIGFGHLPRIWAQSRNLRSVHLEITMIGAQLHTRTTQRQSYTCRKSGGTRCAKTTRSSGGKLGVKLRCVMWRS